jgi:hypothetical protein
MQTENNIVSAAEARTRSVNGKASFASTIQVSWAE